MAKAGGEGGAWGGASVLWAWLARQPWLSVCRGGGGTRLDRAPLGSNFGRMALGDGRRRSNSAGWSAELDSVEVWWDWRSERSGGCLLTVPAVSVPPGV